jgi:hypothetical protein
MQRFREQGFPISAVCQNARPPPQAEAKRCNGRCGQTKSQGEFSFNEWRKGKKRRLCLDCSHRHNVTPPLVKKVVEAIELDAFSGIVLGESVSDENRPPTVLSPWKRKSASLCGLRECTL